MRKWFVFACMGFLLVLLGATVRPGYSRPHPSYSGSSIAVAHAPSAAQDPSQRMFRSHQTDRPVPAPILAQTPTAPVTTEQVTYGNLDGTPLVGYLAKPADATDPLPALIVIHEWWGLNDNIERMTERLAAEGYTALAVDLHEGQVAETPERARELVQVAQGNPQRLEENLRQAYQYLETEQQAPKIGSIGWCFGGSWSLNTALLFPDQLDATVIYYGGQLVTDSAQLTALEVPILGIFGELDDNPSPETVRQFESALNTLDKSAEIYIYEGADHAFANPSGTRYNAVAAASAWEKTIAFLDQHLKEPEAN